MVEARAFVRMYAGQTLKKKSCQTKLNADIHLRSNGLTRQDIQAVWITMDRTQNHPVVLLKYVASDGGNYKAAIQIICSYDRRAQDRPISKILGAGCT